MNTRTKSIAATGISIGAVAAIIAGVYAFGLGAPAAQPTPEPTVSQEAAEPAVPFVAPTSVDTVERRAAAAAETARIEAERIAAEQAAAAAAEAARIAAEQEAARQAEQQQSSGGAPSAPSAPAAPIKCPPGSTANSSDGVNDTSCFPDICYSIAVPDPNHPECDVAFRP